MSPPNVNQLEQAISNLPREEQLWLVERIIHNLRVQSAHGEIGNHQATFEQQLTYMANDPAIQTELRAMNQAFAATEMDGLEQW